MAEEKPIDNNINNNKSGDTCCVPQSKILWRTFDEICRLRRKRRREEQKQESEEQKYSDSDFEDDENWRKYFAGLTPCLEKPDLGHDAWRIYRNSLATKKEEEAASSPPIPSYSMEDIWLLMNKGYNPLKTQEAVKAEKEKKIG